MKKLILILVVVFSGAVTWAADHHGAEEPKTCEAFAPLKKSGGDAFPWSVAKPFPWNSIQGVWTTDDTSPPLLFRFKVTRSTAQIKQLYVEIIDSQHCEKAFIRGVGTMSTSEKNVIRLNMNSVLVKLAMFNTSDLPIQHELCGPRTLGATFYRLEGQTQGRSAYAAEESIEAQSVVLKKVSNTLDVKCEK